MEKQEEAKELIKTIEHQMNDNDSHENKTLDSDTDPKFLKMRAEYEAKI